MTARRASTSAVAAVLGAALLMLLLVTWAASIGPDDVLRGDGIEPRRSTPSATTDSASATPGLDDGTRLEHSSPDGANPVIRTIAFFVEVVTLCLVLWLFFILVRWLHEMYDARRRRDARPENVEFDVIDAPRQVADEILLDAAEQRRVLSEGAPRDAIVECWQRFETQAGAAGFARGDWETSSEFTLRILEMVDADRGAVVKLAGLYREARFSEHDMTELDRSAAVQALDDIHHSLVHAKTRTAP